MLAGALDGATKEQQASKSFSLRRVEEPIDIYVLRSDGDSNKGKWKEMENCIEVLSNQLG